MQHLNIEIKARSKNISSVRKLLQSENALFKGVDRQKDTYFHCQSGRMKLREGNVENSLIYYQRDDQSDLKTAKVNLVKLEANNNMRELLRKSNGIKTVVEKIREIYFIDNVKFHLDTLEGLGTFVEIEAIDSNGSLSVESLQKQCDHYIKIFKIKNEDLIKCSYSDFMIEKANEFYHEISKKFETFSFKIIETFENNKMEHLLSKIDHVCFRVQSYEEYTSYQKMFLLIADKLISSEVSGREISTYRLHKPLIIKDHSVDILELPSPKSSSSYNTGFEHVEVVIEESFDEFSSRYEVLDFDWNGTRKENNPELRLKFEGYSIKFHYQSLEDIVLKELSYRQ